MWIDPAHFLRLWRRPGAWRGHLVLVSLPEAGGGCKDELISQSMLAGSPRGRPVKSPFTLLTQGGRQKKGENEATSNENKRPGQRIALAVRISKSIRHFLSPWLFFFRYPPIGSGGGRVERDEVAACVTVVGPAAAAISL